MVGLNGFIRIGWRAMMGISLYYACFRKLFPGKTKRGVLYGISKYDDLFISYENSETLLFWFLYL